jgi:hypothetical protein
MKNNRIISELKRIAEENDGLLQPEIVVEKARPATSPLHHKFDWNNTSAARKYRIWQARQLIAVSVQMIDGVNNPVDVFVSLTSDRRQGGYRVMTDVLSNSQMKAQMLQDAMDELQALKMKYGQLRDLAAVWSAVRKVKVKRR